MDYEKKYKELIAKVKKEYLYAKTGSTKNVLESICPELAESEEEEVRKILIRHIRQERGSLSNDEASKCIEWLEKQCEQKKVFKSDEMTTLEVKLSSLVVDAVHIYCKENKLDTPHFVGLTLGDRLAKEWSKEILESAKKEFEEIESKPTDKVEQKFHEGDIIIHKELGGDYIHNPHKIIQVDILDKKYRLEGGLVAHFGEQEDYELVEQKPAWSEEDERKKNKLIWIFEEIKKGANYFYGSDVKEIIDWLKFLRPQSQWKPSEEQMGGIECAIKTLQHQLNVGDKRLNSLYDDLKKLMEK